MMLKKRNTLIFLITMLVIALGSLGLLRFTDVGRVVMGPRYVIAAPTYTPIEATSLLDIQGLTAQSATQNFPIGTRIVVGERVFRYAKAGGTLVAGKALVAEASKSDHVDLVPSAAASTGDKTISLTNGASTAITADMYAEGYLFGNDGTGQGYIYRIASNTAAATSAVTTVTLKDALLVDVTADANNEFGLMKNVWAAVTHSATEELLFVGVPLIAVTDTYYFWCQTWGPAMMLRYTTDAVASMLSLGVNTAGAMQPALGEWTATFSVTVANNSMKKSPGMAIGWPFAGVGGEYRPIWLMVSP